MLGVAASAGIPQPNRAVVGVVLLRLEADRLVLGDKLVPKLGVEAAILNGH